MKKTTQLTKLQLELLELFSFETTDEELYDIKTLISKYYADRAKKGMEQLFEEKGWGPEKVEEWKNEHMRTPYKTA